MIANDAVEGSTSEMPLLDDKLCRQSLNLSFIKMSGGSGRWLPQWDVEDVKELVQEGMNVQEVSDENDSVVMARDAMLDGKSKSWA